MSRYIPGFIRQEPAIKVEKGDDVLRGPQGSKIPFPNLVLFFIVINNAIERHLKNVSIRSILTFATKIAVANSFNSFLPVQTSGTSVCGHFNSKVVWTTVGDIPARTVVYVGVQPPSQFSPLF